MAIEWKTWREPLWGDDRATIGPFRVTVGREGLTDWRYFFRIDPGSLGSHIHRATGFDSSDDAKAAALTWIRETCTATLTALGDAS